MRLIKFALTLVVTIAAVWLFNTHHPFGSALPPLGKLINPFTGFWQNAEPVHSENATVELHFTGLKGQVEIVFDERMVPHIFAENLLDAAFAQGYIMATNRLWQMDMAARSTAGRLSEVVGPVALQVDRDTRHFGMVWAAENELKAWESAPDELAFYQAYADGVNAYVRALKPADYPLEFKLLDYAPEEWSPFKSALVLKNMARTLCFRADDLEAANALAKLGKERFAFLFPERNPRQSPVIPTDVVWDFKPLPVSQDTQPALIGQLWRGASLPQPPDFLGSNNWAVAGSRTVTGYPILCNDPHLQLTLPSIWFEVQIHTPELNAYGVALPGTPGVVIGFNENIAWGETNVGQDVLDFYRIDWTNPEQTEYRYGDRTEQVRLVEERIGVRGQAEPVVDTVRYTVWGPIVDRYGGYDMPGLAMRWIAHDRPAEKPFYAGGTFLRLMMGKNFDDYKAALAGFESPAQNFVFASRDGDVALTVNGKFPLKRPEQGRFVEDGSNPDNAWHGFIPYDQIPRVRNPQRGFVASANQESTGPSYPYYYNGGFDDYRGRRINSVLAQDSSVTVDDMKALQNDNLSLQAVDALPVLIGLLDSASLTPVERKVLDTLSRWDRRFEGDLRAPIAFVKWFDEAYAQTFDEFTAWRDSMPVLFPEKWRFIDLLAQAPGDTIFDQPATPARETARDITTAAFRKTCADLAETPGTWSGYKPTVIRHLAGIAPFSAPVTVGGYREAPNAISESHGPSWRMIVELGPEVRARGVYPGGQSGNPGSPFYDQMVATWGRGEYFDLFFMKNAEDRRQPVRMTMIMHSPNH